LGFPFAFYLRPQFVLTGPIIYGSPLIDCARKAQR